MRRTSGRSWSPAPARSFLAGDATPIRIGAQDFRSFLESCNDGDDSDSVDMAASDSDMEDEQEDDSDAEPAAKKARNTEPAGGVPPQDDLPKTLEPQKKMTQSLHLFFFKGSITEQVWSHSLLDVPGLWGKKITQ